MKTVVSLQDLVDQEIHPDPLLREFRALTAASVSSLLDGPLVPVACQACGSEVSTPAFEKFGLPYRMCTDCSTVFASPRPSAETLKEYAERSAPAVFWRERVLDETREARSEKLTRPRAEWVADALAEYCPDAAAGLDLSPPGTPLKRHLSELAPGVRALDPVNARAEGWARREPVDFVIAFDTFDRAADAPGLAADVLSVLRPGGLLFVTAPSISGFDLQVLWDRSNAILPPDKLNLLSIEGFSRLFPDTRWNTVELSTPGMFDVENVRQAMLAAPEAEWPRALRGLVLHAGDAARLELQEYLQRHRLASFARLVLRRR
jgi:SAM-dependent methyltransferase